MTATPPLGRRDALLAAKCKALVRSHWGDAVDRAASGTIPGGAALVDGATAWVLAEDDPRRALGGALAWALKRGGQQLHLLASGESGMLARRAALFDFPITVWRISGSSLVEAEPEPLLPDPAPDPVTEPFRSLFERVGAETVVEAGVLRAEIRGLEVARIEVDERGARLAVGVGKHDRDASREVRGDTQGFDDLFEVVRIVAEHRVADGGGHAAYQLSPERWLRDVVIRNPDLVDAARLHAVPSPVVRDDLRQAAPAPAAGVDSGGHSMLVVCSVGFDRDLVAVAADAWLADGRKPRLVICVPEGDDHRVVHELAHLLSVPTTVRTVPSDWRER